MRKAQRKQILEEFEWNLRFAELKAISNHSLEHPLDDKTFKRMMELRDMLFEKENQNHTN